MARTYENFDITLEADGPIYRARVGDDLAVTFRFPLESHEIEPFLEMFGKRRTRKGSPQLERATAIGGRLFDTLFTEELHQTWDQAEEAARDNGNGLRLRLDLSGAYDLVTLPWEYLYESETDSFISLSNWTPVVRYLNVHETLDPLPIDGPVRILVMISDPIERRGTLDVEREWDQLEQALKGAKGETELTRLEDGQLETLQFELLENEYHVFHFIGHGEFSEAEDDGVLVLEDGRAREVHVSGRSLGTHLRDSHSLRLVVLNNCEGAATSESDPFAGTAQSLLRKGIPAIVAMQYEITDRAAVDFARGFYRSLGAGLPVDGALAEARKTLRDGPTHVEFGAPVLYMSTSDGRLFDKQSVAPMPVVPSPSPTRDGPTPPPTPSRRRFGGPPMWGWAAIAVGAAIAVVLFASIFGGDGDVTETSTATPTSTDTPTTATPTTAGTTTIVPIAADFEKTEEVSVEGKPVAVAIADNAVWVSTFESDGLVEIEPGGNTVSRTIPVSDETDGLAVAGNRTLWVVNRRTEEVWHIDQETGAVLATVGVGERPSKVAVGEGFVWVVNEDADTLSKIDPALAEVVDTFGTGNQPVEVIVADGFVWVSNHQSASVSRIDPSDGSRLNIEVGDGPLGLASGFGSIWVAVLNEDVVIRIDPRTLLVTARISTGVGPDGVAAGAGAVWVTNRDENTVSRIDPVAEREAQSIGVGLRPDGVAVGDNVVWVTVYGDITVANYVGGSIERLEPLP